MGVQISAGSPSTVGALGPLQPFEFATFRPPSSPYRTAIASTKALFSGTEAADSFPIPGARSRTFPGQVFRFTAGGILSTGSDPGTLVISPIFYGGLKGGIALGPSAAQAYVPSLANVPWRIDGEIIFQSVSLLAGSSSTVWCTGRFMSQGDSTVAGSGLIIVFGNLAASNVDMTRSGSLNFTATFSSALGKGSIKSQYSVLRSLN
jgi:hypothetical protein